MTTRSPSGGGRLNPELVREKAGEGRDRIHHDTVPLGVTGCSQSNPSIFLATSILALASSSFTMRMLLAKNRTPSVRST